MKEVEKKAAPEILKSIKSGELTVNKAYTQIKKTEVKSAKPAEPAVHRYKVEKEVKNTKPESKTVMKDKHEIHKNISLDENMKNFLKGFETGFDYIFEGLKYGNTIQDIRLDAINLKTGKVTYHELFDKLKIMRTINEQKQTE